MLRRQVGRVGNAVQVIKIAGGGKTHENVSDTITPDLLMEKEGQQ